MLKASYKKYQLDFREPGGTSRGILTQKETFFIRIWDSSCPEIEGIGECALFRGLSADDTPFYESKLADVCRSIHFLDLETLRYWSSIRFGVETALLDLKNGGKRQPFISDFLSGTGIAINGLIWMGDKEMMRKRIREKLDDGFHCIKLKIGAIDFESELDLIRSIRKEYSPETIELRLDANGAFLPENALRKIEKLSLFGIHSIEQPVKAGQWEQMEYICRKSEIPIVLDEELIGILDFEKKVEMLNIIQPRYIILKPSLVGGFQGSEEWIRIAEECGIAWWITSALESNIGLNAIAQWTCQWKSPMPQGLGTGRLFTNNIPSPLTQNGAYLVYDLTREWNVQNCF